MEKLIIKGGNPLVGEVTIPGAKNAALPILAGVLLSEDQCLIEDVPDLSDVTMMLKILESLGVKVEYNKAQKNIALDVTGANNYVVPDKLMRSMRSSIFLMGPLLGRFNNVKVSYPGGCNIGNRAIDLHLKGLSALGAKIVERHGYITATCDGLKGAEIYLDYPSVGATENIMMAACKAQGVTVIKNAAREPEIVDLEIFLNKMGAKVSGAGTAEIKIIGVDKLSHCQHKIISDRIVAGTVMMAAAMTGGDVTVNNVIPEHIDLTIVKLKEMGAIVTQCDNKIRVQGSKALKAVDHIRTAPYPGFPTDMQAIMMIGLSMAEGTSIIIENVFDGRFKHVDEFRRMGASIKTDNRTAVIRGVKQLTGAYVEATDLRAGAALVIGGLAAENTTTIEGVFNIDRGYERIEDLFTQIGGNIRRIDD
ncbi:UDP-N-acetylglucosamine 1-carboxyvinyltransferase [Alkalicella caledoniensis]|uniref:UDP-N-acetylglucosamine 1-carboxyvinyltransferase n=1 Tax=Alkalicella caledoniensis TaxID=2731377 RepID=A0A7G9WC95_ALKCA|nr:UDP-N-acetylglucosamine 1-carboxyvinyltransferase [Alkalicella caledoniensis]QNO16307.1 UDP-N-acetylglucosamine 1-carboxyvinyltransferase [Alkalicella caledoniensis]